MRASWLQVLAVGFGILLSSSGKALAQAQIPNSIPQGALSGFGLSPNGAIMPQVGGNNGNGLTQQQFGTVMGLRALQGMGRHGVQTGVQNPIMNGFGGSPGIMPAMEQSPASGSGKKHKSSHTKRDEARAQKAEQKRLAAAAKAKPKPEKAAKKSRKEKSLQ